MIAGSLIAAAIFMFLDELLKTQNETLRESIDAVFQQRGYKEKKLLYHYTNIQALASGLLVKEPATDKEISLWATDTKYLNDQTEVMHGSTMLKQLKEEMGEEKNEVIEHLLRCRHYTISFSEEGDSIPMWSTYGKKGDGLALGFDHKVLKKELTDVYPCLYSKEDVEAIIKQHEKLVLEEQSKKSNDTDTHGHSESKAFLQALLPCIIKHSAYKYEREHRFVHSEPSPEKEVKFRYANNLIIPYIIKYLPKKALKKIIIGPNLDQERTRESIQLYLDSLGFKDVEIVSSSVPFRNL